MSDQTPAGWYPQGSEDRYWDGSAWTEQRRPLTPRQPAYPPRPAMYVPPQKQTHTLRNVLLVIGLLMVLGVGGCVAITAAFVNEVDNAIDEAEESDQIPGRADNPLEITPGEAFEVDGFNYAAGWTVEKDQFGYIDIEGLKVTNNRDEKDGAFVEIKFWKGSEVLALDDCSTEQVDVATTSTLSCLGVEKMPKNYDRITINDSF